MPVIFCTRCCRQTQAQRCSVLSKAVGSRRQVRLWANRCVECGTEHVAPDASRAPARQASRRVARDAAELERAGQLALFGRAGRR